MAIGIIFDVPGGTQEEYDRVLARLGESLPASLWVHAAGAGDGGWVIVEVWESAEAQASFQRQVGQAFQEAGFPPTTARFFAIHNLVRH